MRWPVILSVLAKDLGTKVALPLVSRSFAGLPAQDDVFCELKLALARTQDGDVSSVMITRRVVAIEAGEDGGFAEQSEIRVALQEGLNHVLILFRPDTAGAVDEQAAR